MIGIRVGYIRVSSEDQNTERQLENISLQQIFIDKASGKDTKRPQFEEMMRFVRIGDTIVVHSMDRLARNLNDLRTIVQTLTKKGICIEFVKENLVFKGEDSPMAILMLSIMGAFAEFERSIIRERQMEGIAIAKKKGLYKGRKKCLTNEQVLEVKEKLKLGFNKSKIARDYGVSRSTIYEYIR